MKANLSEDPQSFYGLLEFNLILLEKLQSWFCLVLPNLDFWFEYFSLDCLRSIFVVVQVLMACTSCFEYESWSCTSFPDHAQQFDSRKNKKKINFSKNMHNIWFSVNSPINFNKPIHLTFYTFFICLLINYN